jgi:hypothetical protein
MHSTTIFDGFHLEGGERMPNGVTQNNAELVTLYLSVCLNCIKNEKMDKDICMLLLQYECLQTEQMQLRFKT